MKKPLLIGTYIFLLVFVSASVYSAALSDERASQASSTPIPPQLIKIPMADGLELEGEFYPTGAIEKAPAALLLHQSQGSGYDWREFALPLQEQGYSVLAIDMRGHGLTGGDVNWRLAESDAVALMDWLRDQPTVDPDRVAIGGASIGANLALRVCSVDEACHAVIALSPGINYFGIRTPEAIEAMEDKAVLLVAAQNDIQSATPTKHLTLAIPSSVSVMTRMYGSARQHGTGLFFFEDLIPLMLGWFDSYN